MNGIRNIIKSRLNIDRKFYGNGNNSNYTAHFELAYKSVLCSWLIFVSEIYFIYCPCRTRFLNSHTRSVINVITLFTLRECSLKATMNAWNISILKFLFSLIQKCIFNLGSWWLKIRTNIFSSFNYISQKYLMHVQNNNCLILSSTKV